MSFGDCRFGSRSQKHFLEGYIQKECILSKLLLYFIIFSFVSIFFIHCGGISIGVGGSSSPNDPRPTNATLVKQTTFSSQNGKTVSGAVYIFSSNTSSYILRLESLSAPSEGGLFIQIYSTSGSMVLNVPLRTTSGNQNYSFTTSIANMTFAGVYIYSNINQMNYGAALF
jgi:hypothetical protein